MSSSEVHVSAFLHPVSLVYWPPAWLILSLETSFGFHFFEGHHSYSWHFQQSCLATTCSLQRGELTFGPTLFLEILLLLFPWMPTFSLTAISNSVDAPLFSVHWPPALLSPLFSPWPHPGFPGIPIHPVLMGRHFKDACVSPRYHFPSCTLL